MDCEWFISRYLWCIEGELNLFDKILMTLLKWKIKSKKKEELTTDEIGMLAVSDKPVNFTREENIVEIINYVNS